MSKDFENELDDDFIEIQLDTKETKENKEKDTTEEIKSDVSPWSQRPVRKIEPVIEDPMAENEKEDVTANHRRETGNRGVYTGGTRGDRMSSQVKTSPSLNMDYPEQTRESKSGKGRIVVIVVIAVLAVCAIAAVAKGLLNGGSSKEPGTGDAAVTEEAINWTKNGNADIQKLITDYYTARTEQNEEELKKLLDESVSVDMDQLVKESEFIEGFQDITTYVLDGEKEGEYALYIVYSMKFKNIATAAPGLEPAYVKTDDNGQLRLLRYQDFDTNLKVFMNGISDKQEVKELAADVNEQYLQALEADADLKKFIAALSGETDESETASEPESSESPEESSSAEESSEEESTEAEPSETKEITFKETDDIQYAVSDVKCRTTPSTDGDEYVMVPAGDWVHVVGTSKKWSKVVLSDGTSGYIYNEYLSPYKPELPAEEDE
ncbi:MAG: SH3 domain-containing protein [Clostridiales bacterium]|nr:SH3 domain-containing protein [Clostridiales bacterium]